MRVLNSAQMREADRRTIDEIGIPSLVLMENAGRQVVAAIEAMHGELLERQVAVLCGRGNNGGDGFVVARTLLQRGVSVSVFLIGRVADVRGDARINLEILGRLGLTVVEIADSQAWELHFSEVRDCSLIVDAIFGTGLNAPVSGLIEIGHRRRQRVGDPGRVDRSAVRPVRRRRRSDRRRRSRRDTTVTLAAPKLPLVLPPGETRAGDIVIADIGIPAEVIESLEGPRVELLTPERHARARHAARARQPQGRLRPRADRRRLARQDRRGASGRGRRAAVGRRAGHGRDAGELPAGRRRDGARVHDRGARRDADGTASIPSGVDRVLEMARDVIALGPGLGQARRRRSSSSRALVDRATMPLVIDADGLNAFSERSRSAGRPRGPRRDHHAASGRDGAAGRHVDRRSAGEPAGDRRATSPSRTTSTSSSRGIARSSPRPTGRCSSIPTGNPGMATGGTGDVLTGMIAAWLAQLLDAEAACKIAVYLHGMAGDLAEADEGEVAMTSADLAGHIGDAILELTARRKVVDRTRRSAEPR